MRIIRWLAIPVVLFALLGCGLANGIQQIQQAVTQLPGALTAMPTMLNSMTTMAAGQSTPASGTPAAVGLDIPFAANKSALSENQLFSLTDSTEGGQPVSTLTLNQGGEASFPTIAKGFSARFIGDPDKLSQILVSVPRSNDPATAQQGIEIIDTLFSGLLQPDVQSTFLPWVAQNYPLLAIGGHQQTTIGKLQFTLKRTNAAMNLEVDPAQK